VRGVAPTPRCPRTRAATLACDNYARLCGTSRGNSPCLDSLPSDQQTTCLPQACEDARRHRGNNIRPLEYAPADNILAARFRCAMPTTPPTAHATCACASCPSATSSTSQGVSRRARERFPAFGRQLRCRRTTVRRRCAVVLLRQSNADAPSDVPCCGRFGRGAIAHSPCQSEHRPQPRARMAQPSPSPPSDLPPLRSSKLHPTPPRGLPRCRAGCTFCASRLSPASTSLLCLRLRNMFVLLHHACLDSRCEQDRNLCNFSPSTFILPSSYREPGKSTTERGCADVSQKVIVLHVCVCLFALSWSLNIRVLPATLGRRLT
jgi:hypothetical protein